MITKFKIYEDTNADNPEIDDYVIIQTRSKKLCIGIIYAMISNYFYIKYKLPSGNTNNEIFYKHEIKYWSKNKEDLETYLQANKYNL